MTWETFYLTCFFLGLGLSVVSFFSGASHAHIPSRLHLPHFAHGPHAAHGAVIHHAGGHAAPVSHPLPSHTGAGVPFFNFSSIMAFLCWFGGMGYLLTSYAHLWAALVLALSVLTGLAGAAIIFCFLAKFLMGHERPLNAGDFEMVGVVGNVSSTVRAQGTGEIIFLQAGTRRACGARSDSGVAIAKGTEVVVTSFARGIAGVRPWSQFAEDHLAQLDDEDPAAHGAGSRSVSGQEEDLRKA